MARAVVRLERVDAVARITLDAPPLNVLDRAALVELSERLAEAGADPGAKVVLLTGTGRAFCAGVDVADHTADRVEGMIEAFSGAIETLLGLELPVVAALNGAALGGGLELALASDIVLAGEGAKLGQPEIRLGTFPPAAAAILPRLVGRQRALDLILTGRVIGSAEAHAMGLVAEVFAEDDFAASVDAYVSRLAGFSRPVLRLAKRAVSAGLDRPIDEALHRADGIYLDELMQLHDPHEGLAAFMEKREPVWSDA